MITDRPSVEPSRAPQRLRLIGGNERLASARLHRGEGDRHDSGATAFVERARDAGPSTANWPGAGSDVTGYGPNCAATS